MAILTFNNVSKVYDNGFHAVDNFNLSVQDGEFIVIVGSSGCGKTTLLRLIAGFETITDGEIYIRDKLANNIQAKERDIAMIFQSHALFPHLSVYENISFPLKIKKADKTKIKEKVTAVSKLLKISSHLDKKPNSLSGGERQHVALCRAIVREPKIFLMDEPLSSLDATLRTQMRMEIKKLHLNLGTTFIYVTHDQTEAITMGDRIVVMKDGKIQQVGTPEEIYEKPNNIFIAKFIGNHAMNIFNGSILSEGETLYFKTDDEIISYFNLSAEVQNILKSGNYIGKKVQLGVRSEKISLGNNLNSTYTAYITMIEKIGSDRYVYFSAFNASYCAKLSNDTSNYKIGDTVTFAISEDDIYLFDAETENTII